MASKRLVLVRVPRWRPREKFVRWVRAYTILRTAESIRVTRSTVYDWLNGVRAPLEDNARALLLLSRECPEEIGPLTYEDIYGPIEPV